MDPQRIADRYDVVRAIGRGGMGTVWLCRDTVLGREVAVKQIGALPGESENETRRAMREARSAAALNHPNAVAVYDVVDHGGRPWLVMEYVDGETLADVTAREGRLSPQRVADIGSQLASALARAHERGIVHRDIKPGNVLIDRFGRPKISDFGIARGLGDDALTQTGFVSGTPGYLSPELARGEDPDAASDVWALGATLYAAVEGRPPYEQRSNPIAVLQAIATQPPQPMEHAGPLAGAIAAMMHADPAQRWDMATASERLAAVASGSATLAMPAGGFAAAETTQVLSAGDEPTRAMPAAATQRRAAGLAGAGAAAVGAAAGDGGPGVPGPARPDRDDPRGRNGSRRWVPVLLVLLVLAGLGGAYLLSQQGDQGPAATPGDTTSTTSATAPQSSPTSQTSSSSTSPTTQPSTSSTTSEPSTSSSTSSTSAPSTTTTEPGNGKKDAKAMEKFVRDYFSTVTDDKDAAWEQLTPQMQRRVTRDSFDQFWDTVDRVRVGRIQADAGSDQVVATLTYEKKDGGSSTEQKVISLQRDGDGYLIDNDQAA